jgi:hypothetical protein
MTRVNSKPKPTKTKNIDQELSASLNSLSPECIARIDVFLSLQRSIDTLSALLRVIPSDDDYYPLLVLISENLNRSFLDVIPVFASSSANSRGPAGSASSKHGSSRVPN